MQVLNQEGRNYFYVDVRLFEAPYFYPDALKIKLSKEGCNAFYFNTTLSICYNSLGLEFDINQCLDQGVYKIEIFGAQEQLLYQNFVKISSKNIK